MVTSAIPGTSSSEPELYQAALLRSGRSSLPHNMVSPSVDPQPPPLSLREKDGRDLVASGKFDYNSVVSSTTALITGVEVLCSLAIMYLYKDQFGIQPATLGTIMGVLRFPWAVKPVWAMLSDTVPIRGYRRKSYLLIGSFACCVSTTLMGTIGHKNLYLFTALLAVYFWSSAVCNVIGEGLVVEAGRAAGEGASNTVSTFLAIRKFGFAFMAYLSGWLLLYIEKQHLFLVATVLPLSVFVSGLYMSEPHCEYIPVQLQLSRLRQVTERPALMNSALFLFLTMVTPSAGAAMFYFMTNLLNFGPELLGRMSLCQSLASFAGIMAYRFLFARTSIRKLLLWSTLIVTPFCVLPVMVVQRWNVPLGIPDSLFIVTDNVLLDFMVEFQALPILVLAARLCPPGLESTIYAVLLSGYNIGIALGSLLSAALTAVLGVTSDSFTRLSVLILICGVTHYVPLLVINFIPNNEVELNPALTEQQEGESSEQQIRQQERKPVLNAC